MGKILEKMEKGIQMQQRPGQGGSLTHHAVLPQHLDEVEGVEAQQQHQLVLTLAVIAGGLGTGNAI